MTEVEIEYCVPCGLRQQAQMAQTAILSEFGRDVDRVALKTGHGGVFKIYVDDELIFDSSEQGYEEEQILDEVRSRVG